MAQPTALLSLPVREHTGMERNAVHEIAPLLMQSVEDLRLAEQVERALRATGYGPLRGLEVTVCARLVILRGRVPSYHLKQIAQSKAQAVPGAQRVRNELEVGRPS